jgi:GNAT superfamily N-acetyltransferase
MSIEIVATRRGEPGFYDLVGPFLGSRAVAKELGAPVWDDDGKEWFVAIDDGAPVGVCAYVKEGQRWRLSSDYVAPEHRERGVYRRLFLARLKAVGNRQLISTVTDSSLPIFLEHGFKASGKRGQYTVVTRS